MIAAVEIYAQVQTRKRQAAEQGVSLQVEKRDVTNDGDRRKALNWGVEILVNNAGVGEGGSTVDIPASNIRHQFEVNVTGPLLLTSPEGLNVNPFTGIYSASKHAIEAIAETMAYELQEYNVEVATINPGPFLTGFNDRMFQTWESWEDDPSPRAQFAPEAVYTALTAVAAREVDSFRNLEPASMLVETKQLQQVLWERKVTDGLGALHQAIQHSYEMQPDTPVSG
ncbi:SDR family NAD(P)-dependent oxidoreductase [Streptomyces sp. NPDC059679]|uniref:SDR family NAD(P)-dependent oxidoreductase n=1 Tax=Streptomyces sp. NPDC059679 TaxID=3346903 RepID=UPI0036A73B09